MLTPLNGIDILAIVDNEVDPMSPQPDCVKATGRLPDIALANRRIITAGRGEGAVLEAQMDDLCCGAHGLSLMITAVTDNGSQTLLFDTGPTERIFEDNVRRLKPALENVSHLHLSHWHRDHSGGMLSAVRLINASKSSQSKLVVDLHPARPEFRGVKTPKGVLSLEADPTFEEIGAAGAEIVKDTYAHEVLDSHFLVSGEIPRVTKYEHGIQWGARFEQGEWKEDTLIMDERFVVCHVKDKGLVLFTGCSHAGVVNAAKHALTLTNNRIPLYAIVGGYHLADAAPDQIKATVQDLKKIGVRVLLAGHCTGWRAKFEIEKEMPGCLVPSFVEYDLIVALNESKVKMLINQSSAKE